MEKPIRDSALQSIQKLSIPYIGKSNIARVCLHHCTKLLTISASNRTGQLNLYFITDFRQKQSLIYDVYTLLPGEGFPVVDGVELTVDQMEFLGRANSLMIFVRQVEVDNSNMPTSDLESSVTMHRSGY
jgi:hypothetical protein